MVMIEGKVADENAYVGRTYRDAPERGRLHLRSDSEEASDDRRFCESTCDRSYWNMI